MATVVPHQYFPRSDSGGGGSGLFEAIVQKRLQQQKLDQQQKQFDEELNLKKQALAAEQQQEAAQQAALEQLGVKLSSKGDDRSLFAADVLQQKGLKAGTKISVLQQTGTLFPEPKGITMKDVSLFTKDGKERKIRVPDSVTDPQQYVETQMPALVQAGFSTTKPVIAEPKEPTETQQDINSIVRTNPVIQKGLADGTLTRQQAQDRARLAFRDRDKVVTQLEKDLGRVTKEGIITFDTTRDRTLFEMSRQNVTSVYASGETDPGKVVQSAKQLAEQQFEELQFLPEELALTPERAGNLEHIAKVTEFLMQEQEDMLGKKFDTPEKRFEEATRLIGQRLNGWTEQHTARLRELIFGKEEEQDEEPNLLQRLFRSSSEAGSASIPGR